MAPGNSTLLTRLTALLGAADPSVALEQALHLLEACDIERVEADATDDASGWLSLEAHGTRLALRRSPGGAPLEADLAEQVEPLLVALLDRASTHAQLRAVQERLEMLSNASFEGLFVHVDGVIVDCNQRVLDMLRCSREEFLAPNTLQRVAAPEDLPTALHHIRTQSEEPYLMTVVRSDGTRFLAELRAKQGRLGERPIRVVAVRDVTQREQQAQQLRENEARLRALAEASFDCFVQSVDGRVVDVGGNFEKLLGFSRDEMIGRMKLEFVAPAARSKARRMAEKQSSEPYDTLIVRKDGEVIPCEITGAVATWQGEPARFAGLRDRSEARRIAHERQALQARVERGQRMEALGVLAGGIAHDFNNLLVGMRGHAELLGMKLEDNPEAMASIDAITVAADRAAGLTRQLLAYAGRGGAARWETVDIGAAVRELQGLLAPSLPTETQLDLQLEEDCLVRGDGTTLRQVLMNLITNAADALPGGRGHIEVRVEKVAEPDVDWDDALGAQVGPGQWTRIEVRDDGVGMDAPSQARIFEPFYTTKAKGHGLGLAACIGILRTHGGAIRVQSEPGEGTCFSVLLPRGEEPQASTVADGPVAVTPCSVLVIDDEAVVRDQLMRMLSLRGFTVHGVADGESGLSAYQAHAPELVIVDIAMPGMDGIEVARRLRALGSRVPILVSSGYVDEDSIAELGDDLVQGLLLKPYSLTDLMRAIAAVRSEPVASGAAIH